jgi:RNA polymerase sigma-70 factor (ECF subfamily)
MRVSPFRPRVVPEQAVDLAEVSGDELMALVGRGNEAAFERLYDELAPLIYGIVHKVVRDASMSDEVTQEIFVEIWRVAPCFDADRGNVRSWSATIAHRRAVDRVRSEEARRRREARDHEQSVVDVTTDPVAAVVDDRFDRAEVRGALDELTETQREAITLAYFGGKTYREVAELLDIPEGTAKTRIRDGLIRLRDKMGVNP